MVHMTYVKRDWDNTGNEVLKDDFKRIEEGIEANDLEIKKKKNPTIPDTLAYDLINHTHEDLTNLVDSINGFKFYKGLGDIGSSFTNQTDISTICASMVNCSIALIDVGNNTNLYPANYGFVTIHKANDARCRLEFSTHSGNILAFATWHNTSGFSGWQQIATTTKTPFSCTASTGYTILWQDCYILNGRKYINVRIKKSDDTLFEAKQHAIFTTPYGTLNRIPLTIMPYGDTKFNMMSSTFQNGVLWYGKQVYITPTSATAYGFEVKCEFDN